MKIRKNDTVVVVAGRDSGKKGKVRFAYPKDGRLIVEGINFVKKHARPTGQTKQAGVIEREASIHISNVMLLCSRCNRPTRVGFIYLEDGRRVRICRSCHEVID